MTSRDRLSTSPITVSSRHNVYALGSSSPDLPSLNELVSKFTRKAPLRSGSNCAPIPPGAATSFTTASNIWRSAREQPSQEATDTGRVRHSIGTPGHARSPEVIEISPDVSVIQDDRIISQSRITQRISPPSDTSSKARASASPHKTPTKSQPWKVFKSPGVDGDISTGSDVVFLVGSETASPTAKQATTPDRGDTAGPICRHMLPPPRPVSPPLPDNMIPIDIAHIENGEDLAWPRDGLLPQILVAPALARRTDWTPPKETAAEYLLSDSSDLREIVSPNEISQAAAKSVFRNLQANFGCPAVEPPAREPSLEEVAAPVEVLKKRKAIQLVPGSGKAPASRETSPAKTKAPKKKPRTITELATAAFAAPSADSVVDSAKPDSLLNYLEVGQGEQQAVQHGHPVSKPRKPDRSRKGKMGRRQLLLSPISAMDQSSRQDFVFGTSSQLAQDHSPSFLRDIQAAMKASNELDDPFASPTDDRSKVGNASPSKLWHAGARGESGGLMEHEVIDLLESSSFPEDPMSVVLASMRESPSKKKVSTEKRISIVELDSSEPDLPESEVSASEPVKNISKSWLFASQRIPSDCAPKLQPVVRPVQTPPRASAAVPREDDASDNEPPPSNQQANELLEDARNSEPAVPGPNFELFTDAQLASQVTKYGFKAIKKRTAMIALLDQCWASKARTIIGGSQSGDSSSASISTTAAKAGPRAKKSTSLAGAGSEEPAPKKGRGRPRKNSNTETVASMAPAAPGDTEPSEPVKRPRGRPKKAADADMDASPKPSPKPRKKKAVAPAAPMPPPPLPAPAPSTPARRRRKQASPAPAPATEAAPIEIADSDMDDAPIFSSSSPFSSPSQLFSSPTTAADANAAAAGVITDVSIAVDDDDTAELSLTASPTTQQASLFAYITAAVKSAPPSTDPEKPSWHEKMLMYDPIVLEDLAAWLNAGKLDGVGFDGEVSPFDVKAWCESKSVCCSWRVNLHGRERKRF